MSQAEVAARPALEAMIQGRELTILPNGQQALARWVAVKVMVADQNTPSESVFEAATLRKFGAERAIPDGLRIWLFRCDGPAWRTTFVQDAVIAAGESGLPPTGRRKNTKSVTLGFGELLVHAFYSSLSDFHERVQFRYDPAIRRVLVPFQSEPMSWPPDRTLTDAGALDISRAIDRIMASPKARWAPLPTLTPS